MLIARPSSFALFAALASLAIACGSKADDESTVAQNGALSSGTQAANCETGTHPETRCDADLVRACSALPLATCETAGKCLVVCYEGEDCPAQATCQVNGAECPVECVLDVVITPGCYVGTDYLCYDGTTHKVTDYACCNGGK
jgi:hypothetical protein